ncbi:MAG: hypothetical protein IT473_07820 [Lysobacter sp.]|nr:hypothetical protein [Lysobacter sp.]
MNTKSFSALSAAVLGVALLAPSAPAQAGNVSNAELSCFVDTYAYDYGTIGECWGGWTPSTASNPSNAVFEVVGLTAGSYTYYWTDVTTGQVGVCATGASFCFRSIRVGRSKTVRVTVIDNATGASKTMTATAYYEDAWH